MTSGDPENPYTARTVHVTSVPTKPDAGRPLLWTIVFLLNLPVPVWFGLVIVPGAGGPLGMLCGCTVWYLAGLSQCWSPRARWLNTTSSGGVLTCALQCFPFLQMYSGMLAIAITRLVLPEYLSRPSSGTVLHHTLRATVLTLGTGTSLLAFSLCAGLVLRALASYWWPSGRAATNLEPAAGESPGQDGAGPGFG